MACDPKQAALALHRFGFGPRAGTIEAIAADPRGALLAELELPCAGQIANSDLPSGAAANRAVFEYNAERAANDKRKRQQRESASQVAMPNAGRTFVAAAIRRRAPWAPSESWIRPKNNSVSGGILRSRRGRK